MLELTCLARVLRIPEVLLIRFESLSVLLIELLHHLSKECYDCIFAKHLLGLGPLDEADHSDPLELTLDRFLQEMLFERAFLVERLDKPKGMAVVMVHVAVLAGHLLVTRAVLDGSDIRMPHALGRLHLHGFLFLLSACCLMPRRQLFEGLIELQ